MALYLATNLEPKVKVFSIIPPHLKDNKNIFKLIHFMTYKVALIGLGNVGYKYDMYLKKKSYLTHYSCIFNLKGFELILAIDNDEKNRNEFEKFSKIKPISNDELSSVIRK